MTFAELHAAVTAGTSWNELTDGLRHEFARKLRARLREAFDEEQRDWLGRWWLRVTPAQVTAANNLLPPNVRITPRVGLDGLLYVSADLLTDCQPGETYEAIAAPLKLRLLVRKADTDWPAAAGII